MTVFAAFTPSTAGMRTQARSLSTIGANIANVQAGGYKRVDTTFSAMVGKNAVGNLGFGTVTDSGVQRISLGGRVISSPTNSHVSIGGDGFFILNSQIDGSGDTYYTRDGSFEMTNGPETTATIDGDDVTVTTGYLVDKNGYYLQGWAAETDGSFPSDGTTSAIRVDEFLFIDQGQETTEASLGLNLNSNESVGGTYRYPISVFDSDGVKQTVHLTFTKTDTNAWDLDQTLEYTPVSQIDTATLSGTVETGDQFTVDVDGTPVTYTVLVTDTTLDDVRDGLINAVNADPTLSGIVTAAAGTGTGELTLTANTAGTAFTSTVGTVDGGGTADNAISVATTTANGPESITTSVGSLSFSSDGTSPNPSLFNLNLTYDNGNTGTVTLDLGTMTQYGGSYTPRAYDRNGYAAADMTNYSFDAQGYIVGNFGDESSRRIYRIPLAKFTNPNALSSSNGLVFQPSDQSGSANIFTIDEGGDSTFQPNSRELSNVDIETEFTRMMMTQSAYNASSSVFRTVNEVLMTTRDLKT